MINAILITLICIVAVATIWQAVKLTKVESANQLRFARRSADQLSNALKRG